MEHRYRNTFLILAALAAGILVALIFNTLKHPLYSPPRSTEPTTPPLITYSFTENAPPVRIVIPTIKVAATVKPVGVKKDGTLAATPSYQDVGWYKDGPAPGAPGSAVIEGHLDTIQSPYAVFYNLNKLKPGDEVDVIDNASRTVRFAVVRSASYFYTTSTAEVFAAHDDQGTSYLNLITCTGTWLPSQKTYDHRLVIFTKRIP